MSRSKTFSNWKEQLEKHLEHTVQVTADGCWLWTGALQKGYACMNVGGTVVRVSRLMFEYIHGRPPKNHACHRCNVSACVNPNHIYDGTQSDNIKQAVADGRVKPPQKTDELTRKLIKELLALGYSQRETAWLAGVGEATVSRLKK